MVIVRPVVDKSTVQTKQEDSESMIDQESD